VLGDLPAGVARRTGDRVLRVRAGGNGLLPYADGSFELVVAVHALEAAHDRGQTLTELRRVLTPGGRLAAAVWGPIEGNPVLSALAGSLLRHGSVRAEAAVHWLVSLSDPADVRALLTAAGFDHLSAQRRTTVTSFRSGDELFGRLLGTFPIGAAIRTLPVAARRGVAADLDRALGGCTVGGITITTDVHSARVSAGAERGERRRAG
jgi:SAM-dependent methyltransferase